MTGKCGDSKRRRFTRPARIWGGGRIMHGRSLTLLGPPTDWAELVQAHDEREAIQTSPDELPVIDIHSL